MAVTLTPDGFARWARACVDALGAARAEIDALNVFPVPDSDTGTNVYLTFEAAASAAGKEHELAPMMAAFVDGALLGARGNSGVIMAQFVRAVARDLTETIDPGGLAAALEHASRAAYDAVGTPVEGTMLTVARSAATAASARAAAGATLVEVLTAASGAAREALTHTPEQLDRLRDAGVVDAGGRALVVVLDATEKVFTGRWHAPPAGALGDREIPTPSLDAPGDPDGPSYEVMYLLDAPDTAIPDLRDALAPLGDSLVVVGGDGLWNVHVHVDDVGAAVEAGIAAGRPHRIEVTHFADAAAGRTHDGRSTSGRAVVFAAAGPGLAALCAEAGGHVLEFSLGQRLVAADVLREMTASDAAEVIVLPNHGPYVPVCEAAAIQARAAGLRVAVIPTHTQVQGLSALAVHEPGRGFDDDVVAMTTAAGHTHHGAVTVAREHGMTMAGPCEPGDVLGVIEGEFAMVGDDLVSVAYDVIDRLWTGSTEMITVVCGEDCHDGLVDALRERLHGVRPDVDTVVYEGGQSRYPMLLAVE
ncbi:DAK2 domain-containing protein [Nocardioidaceae bacterium SCSIO 66511]|nr:DAK2 domain-containing protein [Nocardioidaceae bacterium SCSIO 66511]